MSAAVRGEHKKYVQAARPSPGFHAHSARAEPTLRWGGGAPPSPRPPQLTRTTPRSWGRKLSRAGARALAFPGVPEVSSRFPRATAPLGTHGTSGVPGPAFLWGGYARAAPAVPLPEARWSPRAALAMCSLASGATGGYPDPSARRPRRCGAIESPLLPLRPGRGGGAQRRWTGRCGGGGGPSRPKAFSAPCSSCARLALVSEAVWPFACARRRGGGGPARPVRQRRWGQLGGWGRRRSPPRRAADPLPVLWQVRPSQRQAKAQGGRATWVFVIGSAGVCNPSGCPGNVEPVFGSEGLSRGRSHELEARLHYWSSTGLSFPLCKKCSGLDLWFPSLVVT